MRFDDMWWLAGGAVGAVLLAVLGVRWLRTMGMSRRWSAVLLRAVLVLIVAALFAGPSLRRESDAIAVVAVVDVSGSVRRMALADDDPASVADYRERVREWLGRAAIGVKPDDLFGVVLFDGRGVAATSVRRVAGGGAIEVGEWSAIPATEGTDIASAIRLAANSAPPGAAVRIVLFTDGNETRGDAEEAARMLGVRGASGGWGGIDVVPIEYRVADEVVVESVDAPSRAAAGETVRVRVVFSSTGGARGVLRLLDSGTIVDINGADPGDGRAVTLPAGRHVEVLDVRLGERRAHRFEAVFEPETGESGAIGDTIAENNRAQAFTLGTGSASVLILRAPTPAGDGVLAGVLRAAGMNAETRAPEAFEPDPLTLQAFDAIVLENVPSETLDENDQRALLAYVRDLGGGLVMTGGYESFAPGGWRGSVLEPILPLRLELLEQVVTPKAAVVIVLDKSGSMNQRVMGAAQSQMEIAASGAAQAVKTLDEHDLVGVIAFSDTVDEVKPLARNTDPQRTGNAIRSIWADGGTVMGPALKLAQSRLERAEAEEKHVIVLSDGKSVDSESLVEIVGRMHASGIRLSAISIGDGADSDTLRAMATAGDGRFYRVVDPMLLPRVLIKAVRVVRTPQVRVGDFSPVFAAPGSPIVDALANAESVVPAPPLGGLVLTRVRPDPGVVYPLLTREGEPVLSHWNVGLGKVAAWTSDTETWAGPWSRWEGGKAMWADLLRLIARASASSGAELAGVVEGDDLLVRMDLRGAEGPASGAAERVRVNVYGPGGEEQTVELDPIGDGLYEGRARATEAGVYVLAGNAGDGTVISGAVRSQGAEYARLESNRAAIEAIASAGGGRVLSWDKPEEARLFGREGLSPVIAHLPLVRPLLWAMLIVALLDIATRRVAWDRYLEWGEAAAGSMRRAGTQAATVLAGKRRAQAETPLPAAGPAPLGDEEALEIVQRERERRRAARQARLTREIVPEASAEPPPLVVRESSKGPAQPSSLFEAKRRARERMEEEEEREP